MLYLIPTHFLGSLRDFRLFMSPSFFFTSSLAFLVAPYICLLLRRYVPDLLHVARRITDARTVDGSRLVGLERHESDIWHCLTESLMPLTHHHTYSQLE
ncbi:hypothetical protein BOTBODRAFT_481904 [Botryobasidium botryosum FD-172 SS1]|uniref:Uncharacterized protein n=1 Tax=Botryobasidium botryosum (strain FD-172 SS1) TaxID=930990 RepID=A0A067MTU8_BOTB1|nr:hypothetical protein BOTBODRAFT_481904 [Botryobasidium botryosum FD-172 SS1]